MRVEVTSWADGQFGLIEAKHRGDTRFLAELRFAYYQVIAELREGKQWIWEIASDDHPDEFVLHDAPLRCYFVRVHDDKIRVVGFEEAD
jgi:hypothetical protein